ncbi:MAG: PAS domain S-box protein [Desulfatiglandaceae bacterium]
MYEYSNQLQVEERYRFLAENVRDVIFIQDMDLNITYVSPSVTALFGLTVEEALKENLADYMTPDSFEKGVRDFQKYAPLAQNGRDVNIPLMEYEYIRKDGSTFWGEFKLGFLYDAKGNPTGMQGVLRNIDERKRMQEALQESESLFRTIFDLSPQAIALSDLETGKLKEVNQTFCQLTQFAKEDVVGKTTTELGFYSEKDRDRFTNELKTHGEVHRLEMDFKARDGSILNAAMFSKVLPFARENLLLTIFLDMTEPRRLEAQLRHAQKMEAVGTLAGGIAHDFNNLLQAMLGYAQILLLDKNPRDAEYEKIEAIEKMARRGGDLTKRLLVYARRVESQPKPLNPNQEIVQTCKVLERTMPKMIDINLHLAEDISIVSCDPAELQQIIMNLSVNARDAMPDGGHLIIKTENVTLDASYCRNHPGAKEGAHVLVSLSDTGSGISKELMDHIFEPFFTTKEVGKGTGLGLPMVYGLVKAHAGYITCKSEPGRGTTFRIYFPVLHK